MKVSIIGGGGRVGSNAAYALQCAGIVREIVLVDVNAELAQGEALDLLHGTAIAGDQRIVAADYASASQCDVVVITAGLRRKPDESRLDLVNRNVSVFHDIAKELQANRLRRDAIVFVVSNPVDILTRLAVETLPVPAERVIGLGTLLDTVRFRSLIAADLNLPPTQVKAMILGEHGDTMVPIWSSAAVNGLPLTQWQGMNPAKQNQLFDRTKKSGAEVIKRKGGAGYAVGLCIADVIHSIALDRRHVLPVSSQQNGAFGIRRTCLSVPTVVGRAGVLGHVELELWPKERTGLQTSARALDETYSKIA